MDDRVTLQRRVVVTDAMGQDAITWTDVATVWADVEGLRSREFFAAAQTQQEQTVKVRMRYRADVVQGWRLVWGGKGHDIVSVVPVGRKEALEILALQGVKDGR